MNVDEGRGDTGSSRFPPAEGERSVPSGERAPPAGAQPELMNDAASPPGPTVLNGMPAEATEGESRGTWDRAQALTTVVSQAPNVFPWPGIGGFLDGAIKGVGLAVPSPAPEIVQLEPLPTVGAGGPEADVRQGPGDAGLRRYPPAEGVRTAQPTPARTIYQRQRDVGLSRFPPAEGVRNPPSGQQLPVGTEPNDWYSAFAQSTVVTQAHNRFRSPYIGPHSLLPHETPATSITGTVFLAARIWESERNDGQLIFNPEVAGGEGFSRVQGIAAFPNFEITRVGIINPVPYIARLYLRQTFGFGGEREMAADDINQVGGERDVHRLAVIVGKLAANDTADDNRYAHDGRTQFLNWALAVNPAWDYPANVRGYTYGVSLDYNTKNWSVNYAVLSVPAIANGAPLDGHLGQFPFGQDIELEERYQINGRPGATRLMTYLNHAHMGNYNEALAAMPDEPDITKTRAYRYKYGYCASIDQALTDDLGVFCRLGWNDGHTESWSFTEVDRTASAGLVLGGRRWCRPNDRFGLAGVLDGLSKPHRDYLAAGGLGFIIGDGRLHYGLEQILETYYAYQVRPGIVFTVDFQEIVNPAYNRDRGPVSVISIRGHWDH